MTRHVQKPPVQVVLFDLDGTLLDSFEQYRRGVIAALADFGFPPPSPARIRQSMGLPGLEVILGLGVPPGQAHDVWMRWVEWDGCLAYLARPFPGVVPLLERLRAAGYRLGIVTSRPRISLDATPAALSLLPYVDLLVTRDDTTEGKPHPAPVLYAFQCLGVPPARGIYVGDTAFDVEAGQRAGCLTVLTTWACPEQSRSDSADCDHPAGPAPDFVVASPDKLAAFLTG
jgi:HAD superfamily hydrolase (TIGR01509 family)